MRVVFSVLGAFFVLCVFPPIGSAYHFSMFEDPQDGETIDTRQRVLATVTKNLDDAPAGNLLTSEFKWDPESNYPNKGHTVRIRLTYTIAFPNTANGVWNVSAAKNTQGDIPNCYVVVETLNPVGITLDALIVYAHFTWECFFTQSNSPHPTSYTVYVNRSVISGTPNAPTSETISVVLFSEDVVVSGMMTGFELAVGLTAWELLALLVLIVLGLMVNAQGRDLGAKAAGGFILLIVGLVGLAIRNLWIGGVEFALVVLLIAAYAFIRASVDYLNERKKPKKTDPSSL